MSLRGGGEGGDICCGLYVDGPNEICRGYGVLTLVVQLRWSCMLRVLRVLLLGERWMKYHTENGLSWASLTVMGIVGPCLW